jgi:type IV secretion system protein VirD4
VQQRWRYADDELAPSERLNLEALAHDVSLLPDSFEGPPDQTAEVLLDFFDTGQIETGGAIEPAADDDGVLIGRDSAGVATHEPEQAGAS